jgi:hypothetical protein
MSIHHSFSLWDGFTRLETNLRTCLHAYIELRLSPHYCSPLSLQPTKAEAPNTEHDEIALLISAIFMSDSFLFCCKASVLNHKKSREWLQRMRL